MLYLLSAVDAAWKPSLRLAANDGDVADDWATSNGSQAAIADHDVASTAPAYLAYDCASDGLLTANDCHSSAPYDGSGLCPDDVFYLPRGCVNVDCADLGISSSCVPMDRAGALCDCTPSHCDDAPVSCDISDFQHDDVSSDFVTTRHGDGNAVVACSTHVRFCDPVAEDATASAPARWADIESHDSASNDNVSINADRVIDHRVADNDGVIASIRHDLSLVRRACVDFFPNMEHSFRRRAFEPPSRRPWVKHYAAPWHA